MYQKKKKKKKKKYRNRNNDLYKTNKQPKL